jgi:NhaD family Na+/H+ antiporter
MHVLNWVRYGVPFLVLLPGLAAASTGSAVALNLTDTKYAMLALAIFVLAYGFVILEEFLHLRKSKPVLVAAGIVWILVALAYGAHGDHTTPRALLGHNLLEYVELLLFLLAAMTYINTLEERRVFDALRAWLVSRGLSFRALFWVTGLLAFCISPVADNLTTALVMGAVVLAVGRDNPKFVGVACINIVVAANAGGAFSPFGDITTLMVWQKGIVPFGGFFALFIPSLVNWIVPATLMSLAVPQVQPPALNEQPAMRKAALVVIGLFIGTIAAAVAFHNFLHLPPMLGMMTGLGVLKIYGYFLRRDEISGATAQIAGPELLDLSENRIDGKLLEQYKPRHKPFDIFVSMKRAEWDTLLFFYGVILCVGGLGALGYLTVVSELIYTDLGPTTANVLVGFLSAVVDNIPMMFAVLAMNPEMSTGQWLLVTLTAGVGGSLLSIGSAAGVALMGQARGYYTFFNHLKWSPVIALGYAASIWVHLWLNASLM